MSADSVRCMPSSDGVREALHRLVPELASGEVSIVAIAREVGQRTKIMVAGTVENPVEAFVGADEERVTALSTELGEPVDLIAWNDDPVGRVCDALAPFRVLHALIDEDGRNVRMVLADPHPDDFAEPGEPIDARVRMVHLRLAASLTQVSIEAWTEERWSQASDAEWLAPFERLPPVQRWGDDMLAQAAELQLVASDIGAALAAHEVDVQNVAVSTNSVILFGVRDAEILRRAVEIVRRELDRQGLTQRVVTSA